MNEQVTITQDDLDILTHYKQSQSQKGKKGGKSRSAAKVRASRDNLKLAQQARLHRGEQRSVQVETIPSEPDQAL